MDPLGRAMQAVAPLIVAVSLMAIVVAVGIHGEGAYIGLYVLGSTGVVSGIGLMRSQQ